MDILGLIALARSKGSGSGSGTFVPSFGTLATIQTGVSWFGDDPYTLTVLVSGYTVTDKTMISVLPSADVIEQMIADGVSNIFITNNNGTLTATAVGGAPTAAMTLQVLCTESDASAELGNLPNIVGDGVLETLQATDLTDAINQLSSDLDDAKNAIDKITEETYNLVVGKLEGRTINPQGVRVTNASTDLWAAPVEQGKTYTVKTQDNSGLVCGFFTAYPIDPNQGATTYNNSRTIQANNYTITAPIDGYIAFRSNSGYLEAQIVEGSVDKDYLPPVTAIDSVARNALNADITPETGWTKGVINAIDAAITTSDNGVTSPKIYNGAEIVIIGSCKVAARVYKNNIYLGAIKTNWVVNKQTGSWMFFTGKININEVFEKTDSDCIEFSVIPTDSTTITTETATEYALDHINLVGNKIDVMDAEVEAISDKVDELEQEIADIDGGENYIDQNFPFIWQNGYWGIADGTYHTGGGWQCSIGYFDDSIIAINAPAVYNLYLMAYESNDTYVGAWNGSEFSKTYTAGSGPHSLNLEEFRHDYTGYKFKLTTIVSSGSLASEKDVLVRIPASIAEMKASMSNHSTALDTISTRLKMKDYYENFEVSAATNSYAGYPYNVARARIKQEFIQRIPENAASVYVSLNESIFGGTKYKVSFGFYDSNYRQVNHSGWITAPYAKTLAVSSEYKYYMLYIATNTASVVDLDDLSNDGCIVQFDVDQDNYIEKEKLANQNILGIIDKINDIDGEVDEVKQSEDAVVAITSNVRVVNHRGYSTAPENTIPAFELSAQKRYLYVETDVLFTAPDTNNPLGVPVLMHDASINRTARNADGSQLSNTVNIADITYAEALEYDFGIYKGAQWAGTKIPTFSEFMAFCKAYGLHPFIELKNEKTYSQDEIDLILTIIKQYGMRDHVTFISYSYDALALVQTRWDDVELGLNGTLANTLLLRTTKNRVFNLAATYEDSSFIESLIENDVPICRWTIDSTSTLISLGKSYDTILTNSLTVKQVQEALREEFNQS